MSACPIWVQTFQCLDVLTIFFGIIFILLRTMADGVRNFYKGDKCSCIFVYVRCFRERDSWSRFIKWHLVTSGWTWSRDTQCLVDMSSAKFLLAVLIGWWNVPWQVMIWSNDIQCSAVIFLLLLPSFASHTGQAEYHFSHVSLCVCESVETADQILK